MADDQRHHVGNDGGRLFQRQAVIVRSKRGIRSWGEPFLAKQAPTRSIHGFDPAMIAEVLPITADRICGNNGEQYRPFADKYELFSLTGLARQGNSCCC